MLRIILFLILSINCFSQSKSTFRPEIELTVNSTSSEIVEFNRSRRYLLIQNKGNFPIYIKVDSAHSYNEGLVIPAGGSYRPEIIPINSIYAKTELGSSLIVIQEGI